VAWPQYSIFPMNFLKANEKSPYHQFLVQLYKIRIHLEDIRGLLDHLYQLNEHLLPLSENGDSLLLNVWWVAKSSMLLANSKISSDILINITTKSSFLRYMSINQMTARFLVTILVLEGSQVKNWITQDIPPQLLITHLLLKLGAIT